jgi:hypothetical protein
MRNIRSRNTIKKWARLAARLGLLLTEPGVRAAVGDQVKDRVDNLSDTIARKYEDAADRLEAAGAALHGRSYWPSRTIGFLLGAGLGAGLGILLAPRAGSETREAMRGKAVDVKNKVVESASMATGKLRQSVTSMPPTGTEG